MQPILISYDDIFLQFGVTITKNCIHIFKDICYQTKMGLFLWKWF